MKNIVLKISGFLLIALFAISSCMEDPIKEAQEDYDYSKIVPVVLAGIQGPNLAVQTFTANYTINYYRGGSKWNWSATDATVKSVSEDTRTATIEFKNYPASGIATIAVTETTMGGVTSEAVSKSVTVQKYCPLASGAASLVGSWKGTDGAGDETYPGSATTTLSNGKILIAGLNTGFMVGFWGEKIMKGGTCLMTVNLDGTLVIPEQYFCDTDYSPGYKIKGTGTWDNCGAKPAISINYDVWFPDDNFWIAAKYATNLGGKTLLTAALTMN